MREGDEADSFYVIRLGRVALEIFVPQRGAVTIETIDDGGPGRLVLAGRPPSASTWMPVR